MIHITAHAFQRYRERIAKLRAQGVTQEQFNRMIDEGKLR